MDDCPRRASSCALDALASAVPRTSSIPLRGSPVESSAPHLIKHSTARLFTARASTRSQKSHTDSNGPPRSRAVRIASTAAWPTFFTASRPKRIDLPLTTNPWSEELTSGGMTSISISAHRLTKNGTLSLVDMTEEITAAMYSAG